MPSQKAKKVDRNLETDFQILIIGYLYNTDREPTVSSQTRHLCAENDARHSWQMENDLESEDDDPES